MSSSKRGVARWLRTCRKCNHARMITVDKSRGPKIGRVDVAGGADLEHAWSAILLNAKVRGANLRIVKQVAGTSVVDDDARLDHVAAIRDRERRNGILLH